jgi:hypothetical protein
MPPPTAFATSWPHPPGTIQDGIQDGTPLTVVDVTGAAVDAGVDEGTLEGDVAVDAGAAGCCPISLSMFWNRWAQGSGSSAMLFARLGKIGILLRCYRYAIAEPLLIGWI